MDQVFQTMGDHIQCRRIDRVFVAFFGLETFGFQDVVYFFLNGRKFAVGIDAAYPLRKAIKGIKGASPEFGLSGNSVPLSSTE
jgi:hypothetical protein